MRLKLISCEIFEQELRAACARSSNQVEIDFLSQAPHQLSDHEMLACLQSRIDRLDRGRYQAVLLLAGSCKHGLTGLRARSVPVVLPRAKDCISLLIDHPTSSLETISTSGRTRSLSGFRTGSQSAGATCSEPTYWMAPVETPAFNCGSSFRRLEYGKPHLPRPVTPVLPFVSRSRGPGRRRSVLEMLVEGYWNYSDFLVVPPGWQVVVQQPRGTISAEEFSL